MRSAAPPAWAVRSTRTWLLRNFWDSISPGSPGSHVPVKLRAYLHFATLPTLAEVETSARWFPAPVRSPLELTLLEANVLANNVREIDGEPATRREYPKALAHAGLD